MTLPETFAELKVAGAAQGLASNAPGNAGVVGDTVGGEILRGHGPRRGGLEQLLRYWRPIMKKPGGFRRCVLELADHPELGPDVRPLCAWLHHETTGKWPNEGKKRGRGVAKRVLKKGWKDAAPVDFSDILTDQVIDALIVIAKSIDPDIETKALEDDVEVKKSQPLVRISHAPGIGAQGRLTGAFIPDLVQDEGLRANPILSARGSLLHAPLGLRPRLPRVGGGARRQIQRCPAGYEFGGRFADHQFSNCGAKLFALAGGDPNAVVPDLGAPDTTKQASVVRSLASSIGSKNRGPFMVRVDGITLSPLMAPGRLSAFKATKDTEDAIWVGFADSLDEAGREEIRLLSIGLKSIMIITPRGTARVDRSGRLTPSFGRQVGALTREATAGVNPMKRVSSSVPGLEYTEEPRKSKSVNQFDVEFKADGADKQGCMVAIRIPDEIGRELIVDDGEPISNLHITLAYLGKSADIDVATLKSIVQSWALGWGSLTEGRVAGYGVFMNDDTNVLYAAPDIVGLDVMRADLVQHLAARGFETVSDHGWTPHLTLQYAGSDELEAPEEVPKKARKRFEIESVFVVCGDSWSEYPLKS